MIIGISGKIGSGKDTVGKIIQYLTTVFDSSTQEFINRHIIKNDNFVEPKFKIKKFAGKLKQIISILTGIPVEDLEKQEVKDSYLGKEWLMYKYATGFTTDNNGNKAMIMSWCSKEVYEEERRVNWQTAYSHLPKVRELLQWIGTEAMRNVIHPNIWVNALMSDYKVKVDYGNPMTDAIHGFGADSSFEYPNWIITDMRFPNELKAVKDRKGITIRINREDKRSRFMSTDKPEEKSKYYHPSETALDDAKFDYTINNNGTIEELIEIVKNILITEQII